MWAAAGWAFDLYVGRFAALPDTYGPWAALVVVQLWVFYSALVFMIAAEFVKTLDRRRAVGQETAQKVARDPVRKEEQTEQSKKHKEAGDATA